MTRFILLLAVMTFALALGASHASAKVGPMFGYGYQWFKDADGDGVPNGLDDDWVRPQDGTGHQLKHGFVGPNTVGDKNQYNLRKRYQYRPKGPGPNGKQLRQGFGTP